MERRVTLTKAAKGDESRLLALGAWEPYVNLSLSANLEERLGPDCEFRHVHRWPATGAGRT